MLAMLASLNYEFLHMTNPADIMLVTSFITVDGHTVYGNNSSRLCGKFKSAFGLAAAIIFIGAIL